MVTLYEVVDLDPVIHEVVTGESIYDPIEKGGHDLIANRCLNCHLI